MVGVRPNRRQFFLPLTLAQNPSGVAVEQVQLGRDESANPAWGVERRVAGVSGGRLRPGRRVRSTTSRDASAAGQHGQRRIRHLRHGLETGHLRRGLVQAGAMCDDYVAANFSGYQRLSYAVVQCCESQRQPRH